MKRLFFGICAIACMIQLASCTKEARVTGTMGNAVTFSIGVSGNLQTRAISDGTGVNQLVYEVYDANGTLLENTHVVKNDAFAAGAQESVSVTLANGQTYTVVFWAQNKESEAFNTENLSNVTVDYSKMVANADQSDAFYGSKTFTVTGSDNIAVTLTRPFAQVNVGVTADDWNAAVNAGMKVVESKVVVKQAATAINLLTGATASPVDVTYDFAQIPEETLSVDVDGDQVAEAYNYLSMCYILVDDSTETGTEKALLESLEYTFKPEAGVEVVFSEGLNNVPVQRNWRTNIVGKILTGKIDFDITINPDYDNDHYVNPSLVKVAEGVYYDEAAATYQVASAEGLAWISDQVSENNGFEGVTIALAADVDLAECKTNGDSFAPIGSTGERDSRNRLVCETFKGTFDGNGKTVKNLYQSGWDMGYEWGQYGSIGLFSSLDNATVKNVVLDGFEAQVEGGDIAFIAGSATGTCVFENIEIKNGSVGTYNNGIGSIIGWSGAGNFTFKNIKIGSDVVLGGLWGSFDSSVGGVVGQGEPGATYNFEDVEISCRLDIYNDVTASYQYYLYRMSGMIIGRLQKTTQIDGANYPDMSQYNITCTNVTVNFGDWMNYHYCYGFNGSRYTRVEAGYAYGGLDVEAEDHEATCTDHMLCLPFNGLFGGDQYGVRPITSYEGVTVNYPASYNPGE